MMGLGERPILDCRLLNAPSHGTKRMRALWGPFRKIVKNKNKNEVADSKA